MMMRFRQALITLGACTLLFGGVGAVIQSSPASAAGGKTPTITKVSPSKGTTSGNTVVTITGTNLAGTSLVTFGTRAKGRHRRCLVHQAHGHRSVARHRSRRRDRHPRQRPHLIHQ